MPLPAAPGEYLPRQLEKNAVQVLPINDLHAYRAAALPKHHADPFDRMLVAQAQVEKLKLVSADRELAAYAVKVLW